MATHEDLPCPLTLRKSEGGADLPIITGGSFSPAALTKKAMVTLSLTILPLRHSLFMSANVLLGSVQ